MPCSLPQLRMEEEAACPIQKAKQSISVSICMYLVLYYNPNPIPILLLVRPKRPRSIFAGLWNAAGWSR